MSVGSLVSCFQFSPKKKSVSKRERERDMNEGGNEGANGGENQGAVNEQRRRTRNGSFANLPPPRGKVFEKIVEWVGNFFRGH